MTIQDSTDPKRTEQDANDVPDATPSGQFSQDGVELEVKRFIVATLRLDDVLPSEIDSNAPLFGAGLGLDSVDALELGVALHKTYGIKIDSKSEESRSHLGTVSALARLLQKHRV